MNARMLSLFLLGASLLTAGEPKPWAWPKVLQVTIEEVKAGKQPAHQKLEAAWTKLFVDAKSPWHYYGMTPVLGSLQAWWVSPLDSFAALEKSNEFVDKNPALKAKVDDMLAKDGEFVSGSTIMAFVQRPDLSRPPGAVTPRYYWVWVLKVRPGHEADFEGFCRNLNAFYDKAGLKARWGVFQAMAGTTNPTFMVVLPMKSLAEMDTMMAEEAKFAKAAGEEGLKALAKFNADGLGREDSIVLAVDPKMSHPHPQDLEQDPEFWKAPAAKPAPKAEPKPKAK